MSVICLGQHNVRCCPQKESTNLLAIDADDTLWDCQSHFNAVEDRYFELLKPYGDRPYLYEEFFQTEKANMSSLGFGSKAFTISMIENALRVSGGSISSSKIAEIISLGKSLLDMPTTHLPHVEETLKLIHNTNEKPYKMVVFTKGELLEQESKLKRSGLLPYFDDIMIVSDKDDNAYQRLFSQYGASAESTIVIGNSFKSDIAPAICQGARAIYIPYHITWRMEHAQEFEHERITKLSNFKEIPFYI